MATMDIAKQSHSQTSLGMRLYYTECHQHSIDPCTCWFYVNTTPQKFVVKITITCTVLKSWINSQWAEDINDRWSLKNSALLTDMVNTTVFCYSYVCILTFCPNLKSRSPRCWSMLASFPGSPDLEREHWSCAGGQHAPCMYTYNFTFWEQG